MIISQVINSIYSSALGTLFSESGCILPLLATAFFYGLFALQEKWHVPLPFIPLENLQQVFPWQVVPCVAGSLGLQC